MQFNKNKEILINSLCLSNCVIINFGIKLNYISPGLQEYLKHCFLLDSECEIIKRFCYGFFVLHISNSKYAN